MKRGEEVTRPLSLFTPLQYRFKNRHSSQQEERENTVEKKPREEI